MPTYKSGALKELKKNGLLVFKMFSRHANLPGYNGATMLLVLIDGELPSLADETQYGIEIQKSKQDEHFDLAVLSIWPGADYAESSCEAAYAGKMFVRSGLASGTESHKVTMLMIVITAKSDFFPNETMHYGVVREFVDGGGLLQIRIDKSEPTGKQFAGYRADQVLCAM